MWRLFDVHTDGSDGETAQCGVEAVPIRLVFEDVEQRRRDVVHRRERTGEFARVQSTLLIAEFDLPFSSRSAMVTTERTTRSKSSSASLVPW